MIDHLKENIWILDDQNQRMPLGVERSVRKQNIKFLHNRILFSPEYFIFIKRLVHSNVQQLINLVQQQEQEHKPLLTEVIPSHHECFK